MEDLSVMCSPASAKSNSLLFPVHWCVQDTLVLNLSPLPSPATIGVCSRWEVNADQTNAVDFLLFPPPDSSMAVIVGLRVKEQRGKFLHPHTRLQIACRAIQQTPAPGPRFCLIYAALCAAQQTLTQVPERDRCRFETSPTRRSRNKSDEASFGGSLSCDLGLTPRGHAAVSALVFPRAPEAPRLSTLSGFSG